MVLRKGGMGPRRVRTARAARCRCAALLRPGGTEHCGGQRALGQSIARARAAPLKAGLRPRRPKALRVGALSAASSRSHRLS